MKLVLGLFESNIPPPMVQETGLVSFVNNEYERRLRERQPYELQWRLNLNFIEGNQYCEIDSTTMTIQEIPKIAWYQEREVFNHIAPNIETRVARLTRMRHNLVVRPGGTEQQDMRASKVGSQLLKNIYNDEAMQKKLPDAYNWLEACGSIFIKSIWDKNKGKFAVSLISQDPVTQEQITEDVREGDLEVIMCPAPEILPDSANHEDVESCRSIIHSKVYSIEEIEEIWGKRVNPESATVTRLQKTLQAGTGGLGYGLGGFYTNVIKLERHAVVKEYWEIPTKNYPKGRLVIVASNILLYSGDLPFPVGEDGELGLPFVKIDCIKRPGCFWGKTVTERLIPPQRRYNALRNRKAEYLNSCVMSGWSYEEGTIDEDLLREEINAPGALIPRARGSAPPTRLKNDGLPVEFQTEEQTLLQEISIFSGVSEISRQSAAPTGVKSGVALDLALQQDDTRLSTTANNIEQGLIRAGKQWLRLHKAFVKFPRTLRKMGKNNAVEVMDWDASDLRSDDVIIDSSSAMADSPASRKQMVFDLLGTPLVLDPDTGRMTREMQQKLLEMIELGNWESMDDDTELHTSKAERENRSIQQGKMVQPVPYDDHILHISRHNKYRLTGEWEELKAENPVLELMMEQHVMMHMMVLSQSMAPPPMMDPATGQPMAGAPQGQMMAG